MLNCVYFYSQLRRTEVQDLVLSALEVIDLGELPVPVAEGLQLPLDELEKVASGITENVEFITVYLEKEQVEEILVNGDSQESEDGDSGVMISATQLSRKVGNLIILIV